MSSSACIRRVNENDGKTVAFMVAKERMALLAKANQRTYMHPLFLTVWVALSSAFVQWLGWWPDWRYGWIALLRPVPGFASIFMPLIFIVDWYNRPSFEELGRAAVHALDIKDYKTYYERDAASGYWILTFGDQFVGHIALDAGDKDATIRHFFVQDPYPSSGIHADLLNHALTHCFEANSNLLRVTATETDLAPYANKALREVGFLLEDPKDDVLLFCLRYSSLLTTQPSRVHTYDLLDNVPGYCENYQDPRKLIRNAVSNAAGGPLDVIIDSVDTLCSDIGSTSGTYQFFVEIYSLVRSRADASRLILHVLAPSPLLPLLAQPSFSQTLTQGIGHPPALLTTLANEYLTPPPPLSPEPKFWGIFRPISERLSDIERIVFGSSGEGACNDDELVLELIVRGGGEADRRRGVERALHGFTLSRGLVPLQDITRLTVLINRATTEAVAADPTTNVSFNLNLTAAQVNSRAQVPLPYAHQEKQSVPKIYYDPDSADDIDDDDPDEDLDI
ncbi:hypothetical protein MKEN_00821200 [Mycena kentingensis (nom. inval.)]|nr:hypothetical protein MKEN_00821200 [Mycena kentingensis (nom. inval.)]